MDEFYNSPRRVTRSMTMKMGSVVCEEVKLSALLKATRICDKKRAEEELAIEIKYQEEKSKSMISMASTVSPSKLDETDATLLISSVDLEAKDVASEKRRQLEDFEKQGLQQVEDVVQRKAAELRAHSLKIRAALEERARQREKERLEQEAAFKDEIDQLDAVERNRTTLVLQLQTKRNEEHEKKIEKMIEEAGKIDLKKREELRARKEVLEKIASNQFKFREVYQQISDTLKTFPYREHIVGANTITQEISTIKNLTTTMEALCKQCKTGEVSETELKSSEELLRGLETAFAALTVKLDAIKQAKESQTQAQPEVKQEAPSSPAAPTQAAAVTTPSAPVAFSPADKEKLVATLSSPVTGLEGYISKENLSELTRLQNLLEEHLNNLKPLETDANLKKYRFQLQMSINTPLNAISAISADHLKDKLQRLRSVLKGEQVEVGSNRISPSSHPCGVAFCMNLLAERIVDQGEQVVSSKSESAFPIAAVALALWAEFPLFGDLMLAHFYSKCPFLVPFYAPRNSGTSNVDYYKSLGYTYDSEGKIEPQDKYLKRMAGTTYLYFAIMISKLPRGVSAQPPLTMARTWTWMASFLNLDPRPDTSATVLLTCMEVAGSTLYATYKRQFLKLFAVIINEYFPLIKQLSPDAVSGPISRLEIYLSKAVSGNVFPPPAKTLPPNFW